ncbi:MAG: hypothetical protein IT375_21555 [Polyangiaceae bacterium]|nr:hypothetical protein [Polyangiaceae bacterium]
MACTFNDAGAAVIPKKFLEGLVAPTEEQQSASQRGYALHLRLTRKTYEVVSVPGVGKMLLMFTLESKGSVVPPAPP